MAESDTPPGLLKPLSSLWLGIDSKQSTQIVQMVTLTSDNPGHDALYLSNYATINIKDELSRIKGVGSVTIFGAADYGLVADVYEAVPEMVRKLEEKQES